MVTRSIDMVSMAQSQSRKKKILGDVKKARRQRTILTTVIVAVLATIVIASVIFLIPRSPQDPHIGSPISAPMYGQLAGVTNYTLAAVGPGQGVSSMTTITGPLLTSGNLPEFFYVGAEYCPYCAAERWSMIVALSKFGTFSGLTYMMSSSNDVYPNTPTFSFVDATYTSQWVAFVSVETQDRNGNTLQKPTSDQQNLISTYDCYNGNQCGGLAFIDIANRWVMNTQSHAGSQFSPGTLDGVGNWTQIGALLNTPSSGVAQSVDGAANYLIAAICNVDGGNPITVCSHTYVTQAPLTVNNAPLFNSFNTIATTDILSADLSWRNSPKPIF